MTALYADRQHSSRLGTTQTIAYSTSTAITNAFGTSTYQIRLAATTACNYQIGDGAQTASATTSPLLALGQVEYVTVSPGQRISAIQSASAGTLFVTEVV